jgi:hypothetical protein
MSLANRAVVSLQHCASTLLQTKKKGLLSKTFLNFGARGSLIGAI